jgi:RimJ/RimL family protein N-acetyltransferase
MFKIQDKYDLIPSEIENSIQLFQIQDNKKLIGAVTIRYTNNKHKECEIQGNLLYEYQNKGIMTETVKKVSELIFKTDINRIFLFVSKPNLQAKRCVEKSGFKEILNHSNNNWVYEMLNDL